MLILEDTRQQEQKHDLKHQYFISHGIQWNRTSLYCGDYTLPSNQSVCIDTKKDIQELIGDINVKKMPKGNIKNEIYKFANKYKWSYINTIDKLYHAVTDDDAERFAERDINDICYNDGIPERCISAIQALYVKRHGFFHRGLKRAQNSQIKLYVLVENKDGVKNINDVFRWMNPRLKIMKNSTERNGIYMNGKPKFKKVPKFPTATTGETLAKAMLTMQEKYGVEFLFCTPEESGKVIINILSGEFAHGKTKNDLS